MRTCVVYARVITFVYRFEVPRKAVKFPVIVHRLAALRLTVRLF